VKHSPTFALDSLPPDSVSPQVTRLLAGEGVDNHKATDYSSGNLESQLHTESLKVNCMRDDVQAPLGGTELERRDRSRVALRLKCRVERPGQLDRPAWKSIENISRSGMLIRWGGGQDTPPAVGEVLFVKLKLPVNPTFGQRWMLFNASVVRVTHADSASAMVAVSGGPVKFCPSAREDRNDRLC